MFQNIQGSDKHQILSSIWMEDKRNSQEVRWNFFQLDQWYYIYF